MASPDAGSVPDVDASAGMGGDDGGGDGGSSEPSLAEMDAIMASEEAVDAAAGFEITPRAEAARTPMDVKGDAPAEASAANPEPSKDDATKVAAKADPAADAEPGEIPPPAIADIASESRRIRREHAKLATERANVVEKVAHANRVLEHAKQFEADATSWRSLPDRVKADPIAFYESMGVSQDDLLNKIIETEKPPEMREIEKLRKEIADRESAATKSATERAAAEKQAANERVIAKWAEDNTNFAKSDPEKYDVINALNMGVAVHEACVAYHKLHNHILSPGVAADYVERDLRANLQKSKYVKGLNAASAPAAAPATARNGAQPSNGSTAPKRSGSTTLTGVASGDSAQSAAAYPVDDDDRFKAVLGEMRAEGLY